MVSALAATVIAACVLWTTAASTQTEFPRKLAVPTKSDESIAREEITIVPPLSAAGEDERSPRRNVLMIILPGNFCCSGEYKSIAVALQSQARAQGLEWNLAVGIAPPPTLPLEKPEMKSFCWDEDKPFILSNKVGKWVRTLASQAVLGDDSRVVPEESDFASAFDDIFVWGHSGAGYSAIEWAYPSLISGLVLYGCNGVKERKFDLASHPRPALTMFGERDGFLRYLVLSEHLRRRRQPGPQRHAPLSKLLERHEALRKPIIVQREMNHLQMGSNVLPSRTKDTGRSDMDSRYDDGPLSIPHAQLAKTVVDFMCIHSKEHSNPPKHIEEDATRTATARRKSQERLLEESNESLEILGPFLEISEDAATVHFAETAVRSMLGEDVRNPKEGPTLSIASEWRSTTNDFKYSKPRLSSLSGVDGRTQAYLHLQLQKQDNPIDLGKFRKGDNKTMPLSFAQISKTLAVKCKSPEAVRTFLGVPTCGRADDASPQAPPETLVQAMNQKTFEDVLHHAVTPEQRRRYLEDKTANKLVFGPDYAMDSLGGAPAWVEQPLVLERIRGGNFVLRSPVVYTPPSGSDFSGMYYFKPLTPSQAYEWIVWDCFKKIAIAK